MSPADEQDSQHVEELSEKTQLATEHAVEKAFVDQGYTGAAAHGRDARDRVGGSESRRGQRRPHVTTPALGSRAHECLAERFRWLTRDYERLEKMLASCHFAAFGTLFLHPLFLNLTSSS